MFSPQVLIGLDPDPIAAELPYSVHSGHVSIVSVGVLRERTPLMAEEPGGKESQEGVI